MTEETQLQVNAPENEEAKPEQVVSEASIVAEPALQPPKQDGDSPLGTPSANKSFPEGHGGKGVPEGHGELVLVTGGSGYLGCHVVQQLVQSGQFRVRATVRSLSNEAKVKPLTDICSNKDVLDLVEADLDKPETWEPAVKDCDFVIHTASPFPAAAPEDESLLIKAAVEGTLNVLKASHTSRTVKRVVLTSSIAAIIDGNGPNRKRFTEDDWAEADKSDAYNKSKTLAEKAAWDFVKQLPENEKFELSVINPGYIMGPTLTTAEATSFEVVKRLLQRDMPMLPRLHFNVVDVRDVALAHVRALTLPAAAGSRHILVSHGTWLKDIARILSKEFRKLGYNVPTTQAPYMFIWLKAQFDPTIKMILPLINIVHEFDSKRMKDVLFIEPRDIKTTVLDMANSFIEKEIVKKAERKPSRRLSLRRSKSKKEEKKNVDVTTQACTFSQPPGEGDGEAKPSSKETGSTAAIPTNDSGSKNPQEGDPAVKVDVTAADVDSGVYAAELSKIKDVGAAGDAGMPLVNEKSEPNKVAEATLTTVPAEEGSKVEGVSAHATSEHSAGDLASNADTAIAVQ